MARPLGILIAALGGEGGGLLSEWLVEAAIHAGYPVQSTSIPGVAQRTGATTYYIELFPEPHAALGGRRPLFGLYPSPGDVDAVLASELLEAARAAENGFVSPERTTLIAAAHRVFSIGEKTPMADGRFDATRALRAIAELARRPVLFDLTRDEAARRHALNAVLLGALAGAGVLPLPREAYEAAIKARGVAVPGNLAGFAFGFALAQDGVPATLQPLPSPGRDTDRASRLIDAHAQDFPEAARGFVSDGIRRLFDYQDEAYAHLYLQRLRALPPTSSDHVVAETARYLALLMSFEDIIRVADLKSRADRFAKIRRDVRAGEGEPIRITEFFKPGIDEISAILPPHLGLALRRWGERRGLTHRLYFPMHLASTSLNGYLRLWLMARLRRWRRHSLRYAEEQALIERWLAAIRSAAARDNDLALEIARSARLVKGYSDTHRRGRGNFAAILERVAEPALATAQPGAAAAVRQAREAALADPDGKALEQALAHGQSSAGERPAAAE